MANTLEDVLKNLKEKGIFVTKAADTIGLKRHELYSIKDGADLMKKESAKARLEEVFADVLKEVKPSDEFLRKYIDQLEEENKRLKKQNEEMWAKIFGTNK